LRCGRPRAKRQIPIGYWAYDISAGEPYVQGQAPYLDKAIGWARNHGLKVIIDLHGAPGSQNGYDNSGQRGDARWAYDSNNVYRTKKVVEQLSRQYSDPSYWQVVTALAILNEPATYMSDYFRDVTRQYNYDAYGAARYPWAPEGSASKSGLAIVVHDGFQPISYFDNYLNEPNFESVILDHHQYTVFSNGEIAMDDQTRLNSICSKAGEFSSSQLWLVVGEWSLAATDCARWLNGRGIGARYDGSYPGSSAVGSCEGKSGDGSNFSNEYKTYLRKFWDTQTQVYENNGQGRVIAVEICSLSGWVFWTWKTESAAEWSYSAGLAGGWIPYNPTEHVNSLSSLCT
jgi:glucan 1,3-beta-glucosidase